MPFRAGCVRDGCFYSYRAADVNPLVLECRSIRICHGMTRKRQKQGHGRTRKNTESKITHIFQSRMRERRFFLAQASTTFIAYLYKPEAQAKVLQIPVYYLHIIPSLALQACKARDTLRVGFHIRSSLWTKERSPFDKLRDRGSVRSVSLPNWPLSSRKGKISFNISLGAKSKSCKWRSCSGASPSQLLCL